MPSDMRSELQRLKRDTETGRVTAASSGTVAVQPRKASSLDRTAERLSPHTVSSEDRGRGRRLPGLRLYIAGCLGCWLLAIRVLLSLAAQAAHRLTEKDTIVLADFANSTGDAVFDDTLKTALSVALNQSPFLNVLSGEQSRGDLEIDDPSGGHETHA